jgi:NAD+ kinase
MDEVRTLGIVLHPRRDSAEAVNAILSWATARGVTVLGLDEEIGRLDGAAVMVSAAAMADEADLLVALGGDGTVLRAMRLSDARRAVVLGVNLGKLGFLAEVDVPDLSAALTAISDGDYKIEIRTALDAAIGAQRLTAFNDIVVVRVPGEGTAAIDLSVEGHHFVSYAADAVIVSTPTGSTAYNFSAGGPIVSPSVQGILVTPSAPHSVFNRSVMIDHRHTLSLSILPSSGWLAVEVDGMVAAHVMAGDNVVLTARADGSKVVRLGRTTFYERARRKLGVAGSTELNASLPVTTKEPASSPPPTLRGPRSSPQS